MMAESGNKSDLETQTIESWRDFLASTYSPYLALVCLAAWLHAADPLIIATMLLLIVEFGLAQTFVERRTTSLIHGEVVRRIYGTRATVQMPGYAARAAYCQNLHPIAKPLKLPAY